MGCACNRSPRTWPNSNTDNHSETPIPQQPHKPAPKGRFNKALLLAPGAILLCLFMIHGIQPAGKWDDFLEAISIENKPRFTALMILGCIACCLCAIARILRRNSGA